MGDVHLKITPEQASVAHKFINVIFSDDVEAYWELISKIDKARIYGMYIGYKSQESSSDLTFYEYIKDYVMPEHAKSYEKLRNNNPGFSTTLRYTDQGDAMIYVLEDVQASRTYIADVKERVFPVVLTIDAMHNEGEISASWKVRTYQDYFFESLMD